jgi:hypothetical protein
VANQYVFLRGSSGRYAEPALRGLSCCSEADMTLDRQIAATRKRSGRARARARVYAALVMLAAGFAPVAPSQAGLPTLNNEEPLAAVTSGAPQEDLSRPADEPPLAATPKPPQDHLSRPADAPPAAVTSGAQGHRSRSAHDAHRVTAPHRNKPPATANTTTQLNRQELARREALALPTHRDCLMAFLCK